jgi:ABC-2 type transport system ATP-binding protein
MITVEHLKKTYGTHPALKGISFSIKQGEFYGLLGPNGAGKTTTIGIISTIIKPDEGTVTLDGLDLKKNSIACKKIIGVVPQEIAIYDNLTAYENLMFWGSLYKVEKNQLKERIGQMLDLLGLKDRSNHKVKDYSGGMKRRVNIAASLLHSPKILFMDEPTVGIDPQSRNLIFEVVEKLHAQGMTIVYTTHYMEEAERFCDRIGIMDNGQIVAQGTLNELRAASQMKESILIEFNNLSPEKEVQVKDLFGNGAVFAEGKLMCPCDNIKSDLPRIILRCSELGLEPSHIDIQEVNLETIFLKFTGKQLRD